jgi:hypothetical protein
VADADIISMFWFGTMTHTLLHELDRDQPNTTKELLDIATRHASDEEAVGATFVLGDGKMVPGGSRAVPSITTGKGSKKGAKGGKKGSKWHPRWVTIATSNNDNDKETDDDEQEYIMTAERDFKRQARQPKDHFQKLLEVVYPNHTYPVKHRLKDYTMIKKNVMTSGAISKGKKP